VYVTANSADASPAGCRRVRDSVSSHPPQDAPVVALEQEGSNKLALNLCRKEAGGQEGRKGRQAAGAGELKRFACNR